MNLSSWIELVAMVPKNEKFENIKKKTISAVAMEAIGTMKQTLYRNIHYIYLYKKKCYYCYCAFITMAT